MSRRLTVYWIAFACLLGAVLCLLSGGITRTLGAGFSLGSIALSAVALVLGAIALRR
ncbi:MAG: hypothetical protein MUP92_01125 [Actinobacteria bacterium]|nr:hypothetical protein [Actinomycetota bacterium]